MKILEERNLRRFIKQVILDEAIASKTFANIDGGREKADSNKSFYSNVKTSSTPDETTKAPAPDPVVAPTGKIIDQSPIDPADEGIVKQISSVYPLMASYADDIVRVAREFNFEPKWLANVINFESRGGDPKAYNDKWGASGIIQWIPTTASELGTSTSDLRSMTGKEQMFWVREYLKPFKGRINSQEDMYMTIFHRPAVDWPPDKEFSQKIQASNPGIKTPADYVQKANRNAKLA